MGGYGWVGSCRGVPGPAGGGWLATEVFTDKELAGLRRFPEIGLEELYCFFTLTPTDVAFVDPGRGAGAGGQARNSTGTH